jgi:hypothetical protein
MGILGIILAKTGSPSTNCVCKKISHFQECAKITKKGILAMWFDHE